MTLSELPLLCEGFHQIFMDGGIRPFVRFHPYGEIPKEWEEEFLSIEQTLGKVTGRTLAEVGKGKVLSLQDPDIKLTELAIPHIYMGSVLGLLGAEDEKVVHGLLEEFFDGGEGSRHKRLRELFTARVD